MTVNVFPAERRFCITASGIRTWGQFLADVERARGAIAEHDAVCNMAHSRYAFCVHLAATMLNGQTTVLPPSRAERAVERALRGWSSPLIVEAQSAPAALVNPLTERQMRALSSRLSNASAEVHVFTSGSTGEPVRHVKTWAILAGGAGLTAEIIAGFGLKSGSAAIVGTTPHQHMYGLEATVFTGLAHGFCLIDATVFYPADLERLADRARSLGIEDLVLVTSPTHLRYLEEAVHRHPSIRCVISATAPLHRDLAVRTEAGGERGVFEIYGCTEVGSLARRRPSEDEFWTLYHAFRLSRRGEGWLAEATYLPEGAILADHLERFENGRFRLLGRREDMVTIAGKRQSLGALNAALGEIAEIKDGVVVRHTVNGEDRLQVFVVPRARDRTGAERVGRAVRAHLLASFDSVFVPRQVRIVDALPRSETGKISAADLARLAYSYGATHGAPSDGGREPVRTRGSETP
jgi:acyl-coenzyme A synthetase/AMP-(fatty) acid ligase